MIQYVVTLEVYSLDSGYLEGTKNLKVFDNASKALAFEKAAEKQICMDVPGFYHNIFTLVRDNES